MAPSQYFEEKCFSKAENFPQKSSFCHAVSEICYPSLADTALDVGSLFLYQHVFIVLTILVVCISVSKKNQENWKKQYNHSRFSYWEYYFV